MIASNTHSLSSTYTHDNTPANASDMRVLALSACILECGEKGTLFIQYFRVCPIRCQWGRGVFFSLFPVSNSFSGADQTFSTLQQTPSQGQDCSSIGKRRGGKTSFKRHVQRICQKTTRDVTSHTFSFSVKSIFLAFAHMYIISLRSALAPPSLKKD